MTSFLLGLVVLAVLATSGLALYYVRAVQRLNRLQFQTAIINRNRSLVNTLAGEALEYSRRNPEIDPILQSVGIKSKAGIGIPQLGGKP